MIAAPQIPRVLHIYWDGAPMSFLQYLTVKSFMVHNPGWCVKLYMPAIRYANHTWESFEQKDPYTGKDYLDWIFDLEIEISAVDFDDWGFSNNIPEVVKSDFLRYKILGEEGGYWCDFDVLFFRSMESMYSALDSSYVEGDSQHVDTILCPVIKESRLQYYTIGFLASSPENPFFRDLANACSQHLDVKKYQSIGVNMIKELFPDTSDIITKYHGAINLAVLPHQVYLPLEYTQTDIIFEDGSDYEFPNYTIGVHWFNGHPNAKRFQNKLGDPARSIPSSGAIYRLLQPYLEPVKVSQDRTLPGNSSSKVEEMFTKTFEYNLWGDPESKSGEGSSLSSTEKVRGELQKLLRVFDVHSIVDLGCGDFNWMQHLDFSNKKYIGFDVVESMISYNVEKYSSENISFERADLIHNKIGKYDLVILRDVLVHLTMEDIFYVLKNILESESEYLLTTSFTNDRKNIDLKSSAEQWRTLSLHRYPFNFPKPIRIINEDCQEGNGLYQDKSLVLWKISDLKSAIDQFEVSPLWMSSSHMLF